MPALRGVLRQLERARRTGRPLKSCALPQSDDRTSPARCSSRRSMPVAPTRGQSLAVGPAIVCSSTGTRGGSCLIHREIGLDALPSACRHFPRKVLHDSRGTLISLSHFCPTAAAMLLNHADLTIVEATPPLRLESPMEGLDAGNAFPPLVRPGLLSDIRAYDAWERRSLAAFADPTHGYAACLDHVSAATESIRRWNPGQGSLFECVESAFDRRHAYVRRYVLSIVGN